MFPLSLTHFFPQPPYVDGHQVLAIFLSKTPSEQHDSLHSYDTTPLSCPDLRSFCLGLKPLSSISLQFPVHFYQIERLYSTCHLCSNNQQVSIYYHKSRPSTVNANYQ